MLPGDFAEAHVLAAVRGSLQVVAATSDGFDEDTGALIVSFACLSQGADPDVQLGRVVDELADDPYVTTVTLQ